ncbi:MAG TPA: Rieske 2Fe-2S domain-containing protein [Planctomycetota bacterium]|nr:Rieske 2Fe-2S domain-containing protein [Planctomycetota bacterium]
MPDAPVSRRSFLDTLLFTSLAAAGVTALAPIPFFLKPPPAIRPRRVALGPAKKFAAGVFELFEYGGRRAIALHDGEALRVLDRHCTHQGCDVAWVADKSRFECPCHGAIFAHDGAPIQGPHNGPLAPIPYRITGEGDLEVGE